MPFVLALLLALMPVTAAGEDSLCHRLGGSDAISTVVQSFLKKMRKDDADKLGRFWLHRGTDGVAREEQLIVDFVQSATGCDRLYVGRSMWMHIVGWACPPRTGIVRSTFCVPP